MSGCAHVFVLLLTVIVTQPQEGAHSVAYFGRRTKINWTRTVQCTRELSNTSVLRRYIENRGPLEWGIVSSEKRCTGRNASSLID